MATVPTIRSEIGPTLKLAVPIMLGMLGYGLMFVVDVAMAGHLGETALAASALASNLNYIPYVFGIGVVGAIAVYQSQDNGAGVEESAPAILRHGMVLALGLGVVTAALTHFAARFLPLLGSSPEVTAETHDFFVTMAWAMVPGLAFHALRGHRDSQHQPWISLAWLAAGILANIFFNWLWMFGHWGFPAMGLAGAGWATLVSRILMLVGLWLTPGRGEVRWGDGLQLAVFRRLLATGWPAGLHSLSEVGIFAVVPVMAGWINATAQAAHQVAISTASAAFMLPLGLGIAAGIRVGEAYGAKDPRKVQAVGLGAMLLGGVMMGAYGLAMILLRPLLMETYGVAGTETAALASSLLVFAAIWAPFDGVQVVAAYLLRSVNRAAWASWSVFIVYWLFCLPLALALAFPAGFRLFGLPIGRWGMGATGIWIALATGLILVSLVMGWKFRRSAQAGVDA
ncbi:MAG: MATE family efflux transporter [Verrucomicrobia bacterium]|nr:MATE family efflux transporter [Verrucomicrobiota bacterium]